MRGAREEMSERFLLHILGFICNTMEAFNIMHRILLIWCGRYELGVSYSQALLQDPTMSSLLCASELPGFHLLGWFGSTEKNVWLKGQVSWMSVMAPWAWVSSPAHGLLWSQLWRLWGCFVLHSQHSYFLSNPHHVHWMEELSCSQVFSSLCPHRYRS